MIPVVPTPKRLNGFSIDSLMGKDSSSSSSSPPAGAPRVSPPASDVSTPRHSPVAVISSSFHPVMAGAHLLNGVKTAFPGGEPITYPEAINSFGHLGMSPLTNFVPHGFAGFPPHPSIPQPLHPMLMGGAPREPYPFYPWLLSRHAALHRFGVPDAVGLLHQPFRKPKRIRTAFSPSQLLRLEHAFEKNHYVVGQERKDLALNLGLTETQVKVWFQNRRTKFKRFKAEEGEHDKHDDINRAAHSEHASDNESEDELHPNNSEEDEEEGDEESGGESGPCSPEVSLVRASHHLNRWRAETNQIQNHFSKTQQ